MSFISRSKKIVYSKISVLSLVILSSLQVFGAPGNFDRSFGERGRTLTTFGAAADKIFAIAVQADGKIVAAGASILNGTVDGALVRYNPNGTLDGGFGNGGKILLGGDNASEVIYDVAVQTDGKIVVAGSRTVSGGLDFFLARFNADGNLDAGFGAGGIVTTNIGTTSDTIKSIALQNVGGEERIVAAGTMGAGATADFVVARYRSNGALDESFARGAGVTFVSWGHEDHAEAVVIQRVGGEDKILVGGKRRLDLGFGSYNDDFALARFNADGTMDLSFGTNGKVNTNFAASDVIRDLVVQQTEYGQKIVAGGLGNNNFALARYHEDGTLDSSFGTQGKVQTSFSTSEDQILDLAVLSDGRILAGGFTRPAAGGEDFAVVRYQRDGLIDLSFGNCGTITSDLGGFKEAVYAVAPVEGDKTIAAGYTSNGAASDDFAIVRYTDNRAAAPGSVDFDGDGRTDQAVFRESNGTWYMNCSCTGFRALQFGMQGDKSVPADYDGDGRTDIAVYRFGVWYLQQSSGGFRALQFGLPEDFPAAGDFDDDGKADIAVWRPSNGTWYVVRSSDGQIIAARWGMSGDIPVSADYDGDFKTDLAVFRPSNGTWYVHRSSDQTLQAAAFGMNGDRPLVADFDGDLKTDYTVFRLNERMWHAQQTRSGYKAFQFGLEADMPVTGDFDGDGKTDYTVFRRGMWYFQHSKAGFKAVQFGLEDDIPLSSR